MDDNTMEKLKSLLNNENIPNELKNILSNMNSNTSNNNNEEEKKSENNIDFQTIMRLKSMMDKMNSNDDPRSKLLISLKPYLKESRKNKVDQYIQFLNMSKIFNLFSKSQKEEK